MKEALSTRVPSHVRAELDARADHEGITVSSLIAKVLTQTVNRWATAKKAKA
jgi:predicted HicB family RNase H-like nuclease